MTIKSRLCYGGWHSSFSYSSYRLADAAIISTTRSNVIERWRFSLNRTNLVWPWCSATSCRRVHSHDGFFVLFSNRALFSYFPSYSFTISIGYTPCEMVEWQNESESCYDDVSSDRQYKTHGNKSNRREKPYLNHLINTEKTLPDTSYYRRVRLGWLILASLSFDCHQQTERVLGDNLGNSPPPPPTICIFLFDYIYTDSVREFQKQDFFFLLLSFDFFVR